ncbi:hypothetical protein, conserved [Entamoeba dispar SAW760]|uniref:Uncharacterized protein n=1 Tax=Entamoeba dispar (strain ATCC PRA-260 / SAW760) TaxID=370354 RepID=B0EII9_ENTDS|nr:uncharacterized protein EDI_115570 [Entamoeba dispar SAW760]EDR25659.1 hypothetical protein, conserved [Entamoeba dispar SAW760]|eukprot:EDR25659.1 hypothetical protein, conserved [Entamoeba dispar SAW760]
MGFFIISFIIAYLINILLTYVLSLIFRRNPFYTLLSIFFPFLTEFLLFILNKPNLGEGKEFMDLVDVCWYRLTTPENPMVITASIGGKGQIDWKNAKQLLFLEFTKHKRFCQRIVKLNSYYILESVPINIDDHITIDNTVFGSYEQYINILEKHKSVPLDTDKPQWKIYFYTNVMNEWRILARVSHCYCDGMAAMRLLKDSTQHISSIIFNEESNYHILDITKEVPKLSCLADKQQPITIFKRFWKVLIIPYYMVKSFFVRGDFTKELRKPLSGKQLVFWKKLDSIENIKSIARCYDGTLNSLLFSCMNLSYSNILKRKGSSSKQLQFYIATNLRPFEPQIKLGNKIGLLLMKLPLQETDLYSLVKYMKKQLDNAKESVESYSYYLLQCLVGMLPDWIESIGIKIVSQKATLNVTSLPGPQEKVKFFGSEIEDFIGFVPHLGTTGNGVSFIGSGGDLFVSFAVDSNLCIDPKELYESFEFAYHQFSSILVFNK